MTIHLVSVDTDGELTPEEDALFLLTFATVLGGRGLTWRARTVAGIAGAMLAGVSERADVARLLDYADGELAIHRIAARLSSRMESR